MVNGLWVVLELLRQGWLSQGLCSGKRCEEKQVRGKAFLLSFELRAKDSSERSALVLLSGSIVGKWG